jgi:hypothetical protein
MKFINEVLEKLRDAANYNRQDGVRPAAILWPDGDRRWEGLLPHLRRELPHFLTFGKYDLETKTGPGIWLKCMVARTLEDADWEEDVLPIIYLPGVYRSQFRDVESAPDLLKPLMELQYRGNFWTQKNHKDWTVVAFLKSKDGGLGLDVTEDDRTREAIKTSLPKLADFAVDNWQGKRLEAEDFMNLVAPDINRSVLEWMNDEKEFKKDRPENEWKAFCKSCEDNLGFSPDGDGQLVAAEKLGAQEGKWDAVWKRFTEAPTRYPNIPDILEQAGPKEFDDLWAMKESWPGYNLNQENELLEKLNALADKTQVEGVKDTQDLEKRHSVRRKWVWADTGRSAGLELLKHLNKLAKEVAEVRFSGTPAEMAETYVEAGWKVDAAAVAALASVKDEKYEKAAECALRCIYLPWLEEAAKRLQDVADNYPDTIEEPKHEPGTICLFVDGLRMDVAKQLVTLLKRGKFEVVESTRWAALPSVTGTAKPAASPISEKVDGKQSDPDFCPQEKEEGKKLTTHAFRKLLKDSGVEYLEKNETGDPSIVAWTECGELDHYGHQEGAKMALRIADQVKMVGDRVKELRNAGWQTVRIVTDHGWLLMPGNLPKVELANFLTESKWGRASLIKEGNRVDLPSVKWHWNRAIDVAVPPGVSCFKNFEYSHGGLSLQECLTPVLVVTGGKETKKIGDIKFTSIKWLGLRCRATVKTEEANLKADIRTKVADASTSLIEAPTPIDKDGSVSLLVPHREREGEAAFLVVLLDGEPVAKEQVTIAE